MRREAGATLSVFSFSTPPTRTPICFLLELAEANDTAGNTGAGVASGLAVGLTAEAEVVLISVQDLIQTVIENT